MHNAVYCADTEEREMESRALGGGQVGDRKCQAEVGTEGGNREGLPKGAFSVRHSGAGEYSKSKPLFPPEVVAKVKLGQGDMRASLRRGTSRELGSLWG